MKQVRISRRYFLTMGKYFRQSCIFVTILHPLSLPTSFTAVLQLFIQAGVRFLFTAWHHFRLDGQSGLWISLSNILKCFVYSCWTGVFRSFYAYLTKDKNGTKFSCPRLLGGSFMGVISSRCQRCAFLVRIMPPF